MLAYPSIPVGVFRVLASKVRTARMALVERQTRPEKIAAG
jgi:hypothetical protein